MCEFTSFLSNLSEVLNKVKEGQITIPNVTQIVSFGYECYSITIENDYGNMTSNCILIPNYDCMGVCLNVMFQNSDHIWISDEFFDVDDIIDCIENNRSLPSMSDDSLELPEHDEDYTFDELLILADIFELALNPTQ